MQIPDWEKEAIPEHIKKAAREMGEKAFKDRFVGANFYVRKRVVIKNVYAYFSRVFVIRLREIHMSEYDHDMYEGLSSGVRQQVTSLRIILDSLQVGWCW